MLSVYGCVVDRHDMALVGLAVAVCALATLGSLTLVDHARAQRGAHPRAVARRRRPGGRHRHLGHAFRRHAGLPAGAAERLRARAHGLLAPRRRAVHRLRLRAVARRPRSAVRGARRRRAGPRRRGHALRRHGGLPRGGPHRLGPGLVALSVALGVGLAAAALAVAGAGWRGSPGGAGASPRCCCPPPSAPTTSPAWSRSASAPIPAAAVPSSDLDARTLAVAVALAGVLVVLFALLGLAADIRARNRSAAEGDRMRSLADAAVEGLLICDGARDRRRQRQPVAALSGFAPEELALLPLRRLFPEAGALARLMAEPGRAEETELAHRRRRPRARRGHRPPDRLRGARPHGRGGARPARPPPRRGAHPLPRPPRRADGPAQPGLVQRRARRGAGRGPAARRRGSRCCASTSTASRRSTTSSATSPATRP